MSKESGQVVKPRKEKKETSEKKEKKVKKDKKQHAPEEAAEKTTSESAQLIKTKKKYVDSELASLFQFSAGPVSRPARQKREFHTATSNIRHKIAEKDDEELSAVEESEDDDVEEIAEPIPTKVRSGKKRKREEREDDLEARYLRKIAQEEAKEQDREEAQEDNNTDVKPLANGFKESEPEPEPEPEVPAVADEASSEESSDDEEPPPIHESLINTHENSEVEKAARTVFLGNVSTEAITSKSAKKTLLRHLASYFPQVKKQDPPFKVESIRFRSTAYAVKVPKKTAFIRQELMDETTKSTNAYAVYNSKVAAREAAKYLNGTIVLDRHLRVDQVAHPAKTDHKRCVFVGNLGFVDDDSNIREEANSRKDAPRTRPQAPSDAEEGLWRQFSKAGTVESVRVVRDSQTRVGKGIAYVQFTDENAVEAALLFNDNKYPPLLPRKLRVTRAKSIKRNAPPSSTRSNISASTDRTLVGRASKLLGRAGASQLRKEESQSAKRQKRTSSNGTGRSGKDDEGILIGGIKIKALEGHRARENEGKSGLRFSKKGKSTAKGTTPKGRGGRPTHRGAKRGEVWKKGRRDG